MIRFSPLEVYEMAVQIERNGAAFYRKAAASAAGKASAKVLTDLAEMEDQHERTFADMKGKLSDQDRGQITFDPGDESLLYLHSMAEGKVFDPRSEPAKRLTGSESLGEILRTAIGLEKDSIVFYLAMKEMIPPAGKGRIDDIIKQEMGHINTLSKLLAAA